MQTYDDCELILGNQYWYISYKECIRIEIHDEVTKTKVISVDMRQSDCIKVLGGGNLPRTYCKCQVEEN